MNWIDTAAVYGLGHAEQLVGQLLRRLPNSTLPAIGHGHECPRERLTVYRAGARWNERV
nr:MULTISPECIES: hypothetical protein [unclassified Pseudomonas]